MSTLVLVTLTPAMVSLALVRVCVAAQPRRVQPPIPGLLAVSALAMLSCLWCVAHALPLAGPGDDAAALHALVLRARRFAQLGLAASVAVLVIASPASAWPVARALPRGGGAAIRDR